jgi:hypothetical protein
MQFICLGIIGEYIGKIYMEVKHRPRYIISERVGECSIIKYNLIIHEIIVIVY